MTVKETLKIIAALAGKAADTPRSSLYAALHVTRTPDTITEITIGSLVENDDQTYVEGYVDALRDFEQKYMVAAVKEKMEEQTKE